MPTYTYTHGGSTNLDRVRLIIGDNRGTVGVSTGWQFSDDEISAALTLANSELTPAAALLLLSAEAYAAYRSSISGTGDASIIPANVARAIRDLEALRPALSPGAYDAVHVTTPRSELDDTA